MTTTPGEALEMTPDEFAEKVFAAVLGAQQVQAIELGARLGWYQALADGRPRTSAELAAQTGASERFAREWLEHQAVCGYVTVDDVSAASGERRFALPAAHAAVLADPDNVTYMAPIARFVATAGRYIDRIADSYRTGSGLSWGELGDDARHAQAAANRPLFLQRLAQELLPAAPDVHARLRSAERIADVGCGFGWSAIGLALAYPGLVVDGFDIDEPSVVAARRNAEESGVADRVRFHVTDTASLEDSHEGMYDAVFAFECVHDMPQPAAVLAAMRRLVADDGVVVVMDERTEESFTAPAGEVEQLMYGYSLMCCLGDGLSQQPSVGTGTVMRPDAFAGYARDAGFAEVEVLPIEDDFFRFYRLHP
jgi:2-polyprenyl-3-methyl-5-hydroxy-6-metoxy-1,4-benzoquinol methylase